MSAATSRSTRSVVLAVVTLVAFVTNLDATIVIVGLPRIVSSLGTSITVGLWSVNAYIVATTLLLLPAGRLSDILGRRACFVGGLAVFTAGTIACGLSANGAELVTARLVQGAGGAFAVAVGTPILVDVFPAAELGRAIGVNSTAWVVGSVVGPVAGGAIVAAAGWRWIFFVTVPFAVLGAVLGAVVVPRGGRAPGRVPGRVHVDWAGIGAFGVALGALLVVLSEGLAWGWTSPGALALDAAVVVAGAAFVYVEHRATDPLFDPAVVRPAPYRIGLLVTIFYSTGFFATTFLVVFYLQGALGLSPLDTGLMLIPLSGPQIVVAPLGGALADRYGSAKPMVAGLVLLAASAYWLSLLGTPLSVAGVVWPLLLMSLANGLTWPPLVRNVMAAAPAGRSGAASGIFFTVRYVGSALSFTLALVVAELTLPPAVAVKVYVGSAGTLSGNLAHALVHSTDAGFALFVALDVAAAALAGLLLVDVRRVRARAVGVARSRSRRSPQPVGQVVPEGGSVTDVK